MDNLFWTADESYISETAGELLCTLSGRNYYKYNDTKALVAYWCGGNYTGPILVSTDPDAVSYKTNYNSSINTYSGTVTYENVTWYYSSTSLFMSGNCTSSTGSATHKLTDGLTIAAAALELLELANATFDYTHFRLTITKFRVSGAKVKYANLAELSLYDADGNRLTDTAKFTSTASTEETGDESANAFDGDTNTIWQSTDMPAWIMAQFDDKQTLGTYGITPGTDIGFADCWVLEASNDGETWTVLDERKNEADSWTAGTEQTFDLNGKLPIYFKWSIEELRSSTSILQAAELYFYDSEQNKIDWVKASITTDKDGVSSSESIDKLIDGSTSTKYCTSQYNGGPCNIVITVDGSMEYPSYYSYVTANDSSDRDPVSWELYSSTDGENWTLIDKQSSVTIPTDRYTETDKWQISYTRYLLENDNIYYTATEDKAIVDTLVFDGQQSFKTGIIPTQDTKMKIVLNTGTFGGAVAGSRTSATADMFGLYATSSTSIQAQYGTQDTTVTVDDYTDTDVTLTLSADGLLLDDTSIATFESEEFTGTSEITIGAINTADTISDYFTGSILSVTIWQSDTEVLKLLPCVDESRVPCFYDKLTKTCIYSDVAPTYTDSSGAVDKAYKPLALDNVTELTSDVFETYGIEDNAIITANLISYFEGEFKILKWGDKSSISLSAKLTALPYPQTIISNAIDLTDETITGIEEITAEYEGTPVVAISFDDKATWQMYNGTEWVTLTKDTTGMQIETLTAITTEQWTEKISGLDAIYLRATLSSTADNITNIIFKFTH